MGSTSLTRGWNLGPLHWEHRVLATGPPGKFQKIPGRAQGPGNTPPPLCASIPARQWFYVLCHFFPVTFISDCREEEIIYADFPSPNSFPTAYDKGKKQGDLPHAQFCSSIVLQDKGHPLNSLLLPSNRKHELRFPKAPVAGSQVPQSRLYFSIGTNSIHWECTLSFPSFFIYI